MKKLEEPDKAVLLNSQIRFLKSLTIYRIARADKDFDKVLEEIELIKNELKKVEEGGQKANIQYSQLSEAMREA